MCFINNDNSFYGRETCIRYLENVWKMSSLSRMKGYQTMSATERRDKNVKIKKLGNRVTYERSTYSTSPHTYTGWAGCFFKSVGNKKLAFPLLLSNPSPIFRSYFPDQVCKRPWNFERVPNSIIQGHDRALIFTSTKEACLAACLNEVLFFIIDFEVSSTLRKKVLQQIAETVYFSPKGYCWGHWHTA